MHPFYPLSASDCLRLTEMFIAIQAIIGSLESLYNHKLYSPSNLLDWAFIKRYRAVFTATRFWEKGFDGLFAYPRVLLLFGLRLVLAGWLLYAGFAGRPHAIVVLLLCATGLLASMRNAYSENGSDQLANIVLVVLSIDILCGDAGFARALSIFFIAFQAGLAYFTAGFLKVTNTRWRDGNHLQAIMSTGFFGNRSLKTALDGMPYSYPALSVVLIGWEMTMGASMFLPPPVCLAILAGGVLFHLGVAVVMGFNTFFWAFLSTYPAIYFVACKLH